MIETHTFICGCQHSGTTLMANMFASHSDIYIPMYETKIFSHKKHNLYKKVRRHYKWRKLIQNAKRDGKSHFAEKTPGHIHSIKLIRKIVPGARFVVMVRDGRDIAASFIKRYGTAEHGWMKWMNANQALRAEIDSDYVFVQKYEDLIKNPEKSLKDICSFSGFSFDPQMLDYHKKESHWSNASEIVKGDGTNGAEHRKLRNWQINQPIFDDRGKWRKLLSANDIAKFHQPNVAEMLHYFGYPEK